MRSKWTFASCFVIALTLLGQLELPAFGQDAKAVTIPPVVWNVAPPAAPSRGFPAANPAQASSKHGVLKWVLIAAAAGTAAAIVASHKGKSSDEPRITVGAPVAGQPQ